jgi:hypothetical protein
LNEFIFKINFINNTFDYKIKKKLKKI